LRNKWQSSTIKAKRQSLLRKGKVFPKVLPRDLIANILFSNRNTQPKVVLNILFNTRKGMIVEANINQVDYLVDDILKNEHILCCF
jgi:hypothetical protein